MTFVDKKEIPLWKRFIIRVVGNAYAYEENSIRYYIAYRPKHGYFVDHPVGYYWKLHCPKCIEKTDYRIALKNEPFKPLPSPSSSGCFFDKGDALSDRGFKRP